METKSIKQAMIARLGQNSGSYFETIDVAACTPEEMSMNDGRTMVELSAAASNAVNAKKNVQERGLCLSQLPGRP